MIRARASVGAVTALAFLTACAQNGITQIPGAASSAQAPRGAGERTAREILTVKIPKPRKGKHGRFISPSTQSLVYTVDNKAKTVVTLAPSNPACTVAGPIYYLQCTVEMRLPPRQHVLTVSATDAEDGTGNVLSSTQMTINLTAGAVHSLTITLGGIAKSIGVTALPAGYVEKAGNGIAVYGHAAFQLVFVAYDADGNPIVGPGAPDASIASTPDGISFSTPLPATPNRWTLTSTFSASDPTVPGRITLPVQATPVPGSGGTTVTANVKLLLYDPWIYASDGSAIAAFDELGNEKITRGSAFGGSSHAGAMAWDADDGLLYVVDNGNNKLRAFNATGTVERHLTGTFPGLTNPYPVAYDSANRRLIAGPAGDGHHMAAYDTEGNQVIAPTGSNFASVNGLFGLAFATDSQQVFAGNVNSSGPNAITAFTAAGASVSLASNFSGLTSPWGMAFDPLNGYLYVADAGNNVVKVYDQNGVQQSAPGGFTAITQPRGFAVDPFTGDIYIGDYNHMIGVFDAQGNALVDQPFSTDISANAMAFVP